MDLSCSPTPRSVPSVSAVSENPNFYINDDELSLLSYFPFIIHKTKYQNHPLAFSSKDVIKYSRTAEILEKHIDLINIMRQP